MQAHLPAVEAVLERDCGRIIHPIDLKEKAVDMKKVLSTTAQEHLLTIFLNCGTLCCCQFLICIHPYLSLITC